MLGIWNLKYLMIIGHQAQLSFLRRSFENGRMPHAYLFVGPEGVGKKKAAGELANWCLGRKEGKSEMSQDFEIKFLERTYDEKNGSKHKDISINQIHEVREFLDHHGFVSCKKIVIIDEAEKMNVSASNALLKTLEEPSEKSLLILLATDEKKLLSTIFSRCQIIRFYPVPTKEIYEALVAKGAKRDLALEIARLSFGSPGRALTMFSQPEEMEFYQQESERFLNLLKGDLASRFVKMEDLFKEKKQVDHIERRDKLIKILGLWLGFWRDILICQGKSEELAGNLSILESLKKQIKRYSFVQIVSFCQKIEEARRLLGQNIHPKLIFENLVLSFY